MNKKGFVLTETLMVTVFIVVIFTFVYTAVIPLLGIYRDKADREHNIDIAYKLYHLRKMIKQDANEADIVKSNLRRVDCVDLENKEYCNTLMGYLDLEQYDLFFTKSIAGNINDIKNISKEMEEYITPYSGSTTPSLILLDKENHTAVHLNYYNRNVMGDFTSIIENNAGKITEIYFKKEPTIVINEKYRNIDSSLKTNLTYNNQGRVLAWLEPDLNNSGKYILYIESNDTIYLHEGQNLFYHFTVLNKIDLSNVDTSELNTMFGMFNGCKSLTSLDLSNFNTENVTDMGMMFHDMENLVSLNISNFNTSKVESMKLMFCNCKKMTDLVLGNFNTEKVSDMSLMFSGCYKLNSLNLSSFNTKNVSNMSWMFQSCKNLETLDLSSFDTRNVETMSLMFSYCQNLTYLDISSFVTTKVENMSQMFANCEKLSVLNLQNFDTKKVANMNGMFSNCYNLILLNLSSFNTEKVTDMLNMFNNCGELETIYVSNMWTIAKISDLTDVAFKDCFKLKGGNGTTYLEENRYVPYAVIDREGSPGYLTLWT